MYNIGIVLKTERQLYFEKTRQIEIGQYYGKSYKIGPIHPFLKHTYLYGGVSYSTKSLLPSTVASYRLQAKEN